MIQHALWFDEIDRNRNDVVDAHGFANGPGQPITAMES
jgi:hypothetical protein